MTSTDPQAPSAPIEPSAPRPAVHGLSVTALTQCAHWHSRLDIIAIKHACCGTYYACISCHAALADHAAAVWPRSAQHGPERVVLCGQCGREWTAAEYLGSGNLCPGEGCGAGFNPGCRAHYELYFEM